MPKKSLKKINRRQLYIKSAEILKPHLNLSNWTIKLRFVSTMGIRDLAEIDAYPEYKSAKIRINKNRLTECTHADIITTVIHELLHCHLWGFSAWAEQLCRKDPIKLEVCRLQEEGLITTFELMLYNILYPIIVGELEEQGYTINELGPNARSADIKIH